MEKISVEIMGQTIDVVVKDGNTADFHKISEYYKKITERIAKNYPYKTSLEIATLAGLTITEELYSLAKSKTKNPSGNDQKIDAIISSAIKQLELSLKL